MSSAISLARNQRVTDVLLRLPPPLPLKQVRVRVLMPDGTPASGATLLINAVPAYLNQIQVRVDDKGSASYSWVQGSASSLDVYTANHYASATVKPTET